MISKQKKDKENLNFSLRTIFAETRKTKKGETKETVLQTYDKKYCQAQPQAPTKTRG